MYFSPQVAGYKTPHKATTVLIFILFTIEGVSFFFLFRFSCSLLNVSHKTLLSAAELRQINELFCRFAMASALYCWINDASPALSLRL